MVFVDPIPGIGEEEFADWSGIRTVEIDRFTPFVCVAVGKIIGRKALQIISVRPDVIVDNVQDHGDPEPMCPVDETAEVARAAVEARWRKQVDAVVAPPEAAG